VIRWRNGGLHRRSYETHEFHSDSTLPIQRQPHIPVGGSAAHADRSGCRMLSERTRRASFRSVQPPGTWLQRCPCRTAS
jgi:hypothetical protein